MCQLCLAADDREELEVAVGQRLSTALTDNEHRPRLPGRGQHCRGCGVSRQFRVLQVRREQSRRTSADEVVPPKPNHIASLHVSGLGGEPVHARTCGRRPDRSPGHRQAAPRRIRDPARCRIGTCRCQPVRKADEHGVPPGTLAVDDLAHPRLQPTAVALYQDGDDDRGEHRSLHLFPAQPTRDDRRRQDDRTGERRRAGAEHDRPRQCLVDHPQPPSQQRGRHPECPHGHRDHGDREVHLPRLDTGQRPQRDLEQDSGAETHCPHPDLLAHHRAGSGVAQQQAHRPHKRQDTDKDARRPGRRRMEATALDRGHHPRQVTWNGKRGTVRRGQPGSDGHRSEEQCRAEHEPAPPLDRAVTVGKQPEEEHPRHRKGDVEQPHGSDRVLPGAPPRPGPARRAPRQPARPRRSAGEPATRCCPA